MRQLSLLQKDGVTNAQSFAGFGRSDSRVHGEPALCYHVDFRKDTQNPGKTFAPFRVIAEGRLDGFLGWFEARLCEGVTLSNSPYLPLTSWWQLYLPVAEQPHYRAGQTMLLYLDPKITDGEAEWSYSVQPATPECSASVSQK